MVVTYCSHCASDTFGVTAFFHGFSFVPPHTLQPYTHNFKVVLSGCPLCFEINKNAVFLCASVVFFEENPTAPEGGQAHTPLVEVRYNRQNGA